MGAKVTRFKNAFSDVKDTLKFSDKLFMAVHGPITIAQGSKSRKISYRAFVHEFVREKNRAKNLNRAKIVLLNC